MKSKIIIVIFTDSMRAFITNGIVAWEIPPGRISTFYLKGAYLAPQGWRIDVPDKFPRPPWFTGECGELRKEMEVKNG
jgi:hypothetical protein